MNTKQIEYVMAIWKCGGFSQASKELFISQPSLSQYILNLEKQLGATLFDRKTSPLQLTDAGRIYVKYATQILDCYKKIEQEIRGLSYTTSGHISIGASTYVAQHLLPPVISEFKKKFTNVSISVKEMLHEHRQQAALKGETDFFFTFRPIKDTRIEYLHILPERILLALPPTHRLVNPETLQYQEEIAIPALRLRDYHEATLPFENDFPSSSLYELRDDAFVVTRSEGQLRNLAMELFNQLGFEPKIVLESKGIDVACAMALKGVGITFIPETTPRFVNFKRHPIYYRIQEYDNIRYFCVGYNKARQLSLLRDEFVNTTVRILKSPVLV